MKRGWDLKYLIGEMSKLVGISNETIRYYEREGAIHAKKDKDTGYRYYSALDLTLLMRARMYRSCGFSLPEISHMLNHCEVDELEDLLAEKRSELREQIVWLEHVERRLTDMEAVLHEIPHMLNRCVQTTSPALFRLEFQQQDRITKNKDILVTAKEWINKMPLVFPSARFLRQDILDQNDQYSMGLAVYAHDAEYLGIAESPLVQHFSPRHCVYTVIEGREGELLHPGMIKHALEYVKENGLFLASDAIGVAVTSLKKSEAHIRYHQIWLPLGQEDK